jgi:hypothetical protein
MRIVTLEEYEEIASSQDVVEIENNGNSGRNPYLVWHTIKYSDGTEEDIYTK